MDARELLEKLQCQSELKAHGITMTPVYGDAKDCVARMIIPLNNKMQVVEIQIKELCVYEGLKA